ncbi:H-type small acid-soluble spore protein [Phosphitispora fastidiosa]|uniref:H-type small acid-soluble spore protein n=1 Tax=Phosphitispora fastidiosa TaxID=2837202 RepID=UPI001E60171D|nr:H-type small acid-soluble spore protein [Phosphitispora fastidiosa]MBU7008860.1 H-type small acid-soluble spore protein [Phosphitispora fastidiosa]
MDYKRASEIIKSQETIDVTFNGQNIWIKNLNHNNNTAVVTPTTEGQPDITVSIDELKEN